MMSQALMPCALCPVIPADMMFKKEAETKQVPPNSHQTHLCLGPKDVLGKVTKPHMFLFGQLHSLA